MIPEETVRQILDTARVEEVVGDYVTLRRQGSSYVACCPFHNEKTPSFVVTPSKGIYKCFGCGKSGTAVGFVMEEEKCSFPDALRYLAKKYNIEIREEEESAETIAKRQRHETLLQVSEFAQKFFVSSLDTPEGKSVAMAYFHQRGLQDDTIAKFGLGWAPKGRTSFVDTALKKGYRPEYLVDAGVAIRREEDGSLYDKFRERVMFPIHSVSGRVIAFSGRTLHAELNAKYVNSPETEIYRKSNILMGIWFAKSEISRLGKCILVEGNLDMVMMHQTGIRNVVASCGTALTVEQVRLIKRFTENITIMYDGDSAGIHAAMRGLRLVLGEGMNVKVLLLPDGDDPDSFCRKHTLAEVQEFISGNERDFIDFKTALLLDSAENDPLKKANLINEIADDIAVIPDAVKRAVYVQACAKSFDIEDSILSERIQSTRQRLSVQASSRPLAPERQMPSTPEPAEEAPEDEPRKEQPQDDGGVVLQNKILAPTERDLLNLLLTHGCDELVFPSDSEYYGGEDSPRPTVADFIRDALEGDGTIMANEAYASTYAMFVQLYDQGLPQDRIVKSLMDSPDRAVADVAARLSSERYALSFKTLESTMTTVQSWLVQQVPKAILCYMESRVKDEIETLRRRLRDVSDGEANDIMRRMSDLRAVQMRIRKKIGRER